MASRRNSRVERCGRVRRTGNGGAAPPLHAASGAFATAEYVAGVMSLYVGLQSDLIFWHYLGCVATHEVPKCHVRCG